MKDHCREAQATELVSFTCRLEVCMFLKRVYDLAFKRPQVNLPSILILNCHYDLVLFWEKLMLHSVYITKLITEEP